MKNEIFGELTYHYGWNGNGQVILEQKVFPLSIHLEADENQSIDKFQYKAYQEYLKNQQKIWDEAIKKIYCYYLEEIEEYREMFEEDADTFAPYIDSVPTVVSLITPVSLVFPRKNKFLDFGILLECTWDCEAGIGIILKNNKIIKIGAQDIVL